MLSLTSHITHFPGIQCSGIIQESTISAYPVYVKIYRVILMIPENSSFVRQIIQRSGSHKDFFLESVLCPFQKRFKHMLPPLMRLKAGWAICFSKKIHIHVCSGFGLLFFFCHIRNPTRTLYTKEDR